MDLPFAQLEGLLEFCEVTFKLTIAVENVLEVLAESSKLVSKFLTVTQELLTFHYLLFAWRLTSYRKMSLQRLFIEENSIEVTCVT